MGHKYRIGEDVYYRPSIKYTAAPGVYTIIKTLPVENEDRVGYRERCGDVRANGKRERACAHGLILKRTTY